MSKNGKEQNDGANVGINLVFDGTPRRVRDQTPIESESETEISPDFPAKSSKTSNGNGNLPFRLSRLLQFLSIILTFPFSLVYLYFKRRDNRSKEHNKVKSKDESAQKTLIFAPTYQFLTLDYQKISVDAGVHIEFTSAKGPTENFKKCLELAEKTAKKILEKVCSDKTLSQILWRPDDFSRSIQKSLGKPEQKFLGIRIIRIEVLDVHHSAYDKQKEEFTKEDEQTEKNALINVNTMVYSSDDEMEKENKENKVKNDNDDDLKSNKEEIDDVIEIFKCDSSLSFDDNITADIENFGYEMGKYMENDIKNLKEGQNDEKAITSKETATEGDIEGNIFPTTIEGNA